MCVGGGGRGGENILLRMHRNMEEVHIHGCMGGGVGGVGGWGWQGTVLTSDQK